MPLDSTEMPYVDVASGAPDSLVLDIGDDIGALVLYAEECCLGQEIDITRGGAPRSHHVHTMIRRRRAANRECVAGVFPELEQGSYTVWGIDGLALAEVVIEGGRVAELDGGICRQPSP